MALLTLPSSVVPRGGETANIRIPLKSSVTRLDVERLAGWEYWNIAYASRVGEKPVTRAWEGDDGTEIVYLEDPYIGIHYVITAEKSAESVARRSRASICTL